MTTKRHKSLTEFRSRRWQRNLTNVCTLPLRLLARPMIAHAGQAPDFKPDFTFVHMTDVHLSDRIEARQGFQAVIQRINEIAPSFVLSGGDQILDAGFADHRRTMELYHLYLELAAGLRCPIHHVMGNHDHFGHGHPDRYATHADYGKKIFMEQLGKGQRYRAFSHGNWRFILLDTSHFFDHKFRGHVDEEQLEWLHHELQTLGKRHAVIVTHVPLLTRLNSIIKGRVEFYVRRLVVQKARAIRRLIAQHDVRLVLQGHIHTIEQLRLGQTWYVNSGAVCGLWWQGRLRHCPTGFTVISVKDDQLHWRFEPVPLTEKKLEKMKDESQNPLSVIHPS